MLISSHVKAAGEDPPPPRIIRLDGGSSANRRPSGSSGHTRRAMRMDFRLRHGSLRSQRRSRGDSATQISTSLFMSIMFFPSYWSGVCPGHRGAGRLEAQSERTPTKKAPPGAFSLLQQPSLTTIPASRTCPASCRRTGRRTAPARGASPSQACRCRPGGRRRNGSG